MEWKGAVSNFWNTFSRVTFGRKIAIAFLIFVCITLCYVLNRTIFFVWLFRPLPFANASKDTDTLKTTFSPEAIGMTNREQLYEKRRKHLVRNCEKINRTVTNIFAYNTPVILLERKHLIYYCPIPKVSSTFWKRVLTVMATQGKLKSPFEITFEQQKKMAKLKRLYKQSRYSLKKNETSFMFVRDPYARLFSGYVDKIYTPDVYYWNQIGRNVVRVVRNDSAMVYRNYGFDVTFLEMITYLLSMYQSTKDIDEHFKPMADHCNPCTMSFQYIGKLETIKNDSMYLITKWRSQFKDVNLHFDDFETETVLDSARRKINLLFYSKKVLREIKFPFSKLMLRTWRELQMRGYISKHVEFPFKDTDADKITEDDFMNATKQALEIPVNKTEVRQQREEALIQAYRQVPIDVMEKLRLFLLKDCLLFGYDDRPSKLFDRSKYLKEGFLYLDGLKKD